MQTGRSGGPGRHGRRAALDPAQVAEACAEAAAETGLMVAAANLNSPGQTVISGALAAVEKAAALAKAKGARRAVMLPVSAPFHCALMQPAQEEVARVLGAPGAGRSAHSRRRQRDWRPGHHGRRGTRRAHPPGDRRGALGGLHEGADRRAARMLSSRWAPAKCSAACCKQIDPAQKSLNVEDAASLEKTLAALAS